MPIPAIFKQLKKMNYQGVVHLEYEINAANSVPGMLRRFAYMRGVLGLRPPEQVRMKPVSGR